MATKKKTTVEVKLREYDHQVMLFDWLADASARQSDRRKKDSLRWTFSTLNGARLPMGTAMKCKRSGMIRGVPDVFVPSPSVGDHRYKWSYAGLWIEMKVKGNKPSPEQIEFLDYAQGRGYLGVVAYSWHEAARMIVTYLGLETGTYHEDWDTPPPKRTFKKEGVNNDGTKKSKATLNRSRCRRRSGRLRPRAD
jgi:hypothetical protein